MSPGTALSSFPERGTHLLHLSLPCRDLLRDASVGRYGQGSRASVTEDRKLRHHLSNHRLSVFLVTQAVNMFWAGESVPKSKPSLGNTTSALLGQGQVTMQTGIVKALRRPVGNKLVSLKSIIPKLVDHTFFFFFGRTRADVLLFIPFGTTTHSASFLTGKGIKEGPDPHCPVQKACPSCRGPPSPLLKCVHKARAPATGTL